MDHNLDHKVDHKVADALLWILRMMVMSLCLWFKNLDVVCDFQNVVLFCVGVFCVVVKLCCIFL